MSGSLAAPSSYAPPPVLAFAGYRFPCEVIVLAVSPYLPVTPSRDVEDVVADQLPPPGPGLACELEGDQLTFVVPARPLRRG